MTPQEAIEKLERLAADGHGGGLTEIAELIKDLDLEADFGRRWKSDSRLEAWFPFTAERQAKLVEALKLVLLFHSARPWDREAIAQWLAGLKAVHGCEVASEATTKNLCDAVRAALKT